MLSLILFTCLLYTFCQLWVLCILLVFEATWFVSLWGAALLCSNCWTFIVPLHVFEYLLSLSFRFSLKCLPLCYPGTSRQDDRWEKISVRDISRNIFLPYAHHLLATMCMRMWLHEPWPALVSPAWPGKRACAKFLEYRLIHLTTNYIAW